MSPRGVGPDIWAAVCRCSDLEVGRGAAALVNGQAVALFRLGDDELYALGNHDPFARAGMLARGVVGRRGDVPFVGSPVHGHSFDLRSGRCLENPSVQVPTYLVEVVHGVVRVGPRS